MNPLILLKTFATGCSGSGFFGIPSWYKYLNLTTNSDGSCNFSNFTFWPPDNFLLVLLAILDMLLYVSGIVAIVFVIYGGVQYIMSQGNPENTKKAQSTIFNALIGMIICILAATIVNFIGTQFGK
jgi:hypothetical protein